VRRPPTGFDDVERAARITSSRLEDSRTRREPVPARELLKREPGAEHDRGVHVCRRHDRHPD